MCHSEGAKRPKNLGGAEWWNNGLGGRSKGESVRRTLHAKEL